MNELYVQHSLRIVKGAFTYQPPAVQFNADWTGPAGPTPGGILIGQAPTLVSLSALTTLGGMCRLVFTSGTATYVEYGPYDPAFGKWDPFGELLLGEGYLLRLSRRLGKETGTGTGSGTTGAGVEFRMKAIGGTAWVTVDCFDK